MLSYQEPEYSIDVGRLPSDLTRTVKTVDGKVIKSMWSALRFMLRESMPLSMLLSCQADDSLSRETAEGRAIFEAGSYRTLQSIGYRQGRPERITSAALERLDDLSGDPDCIRHQGLNVQT